MIIDTGALGLLVSYWLVSSQRVKQIKLISRTGRAAATSGDGGQGAAPLRQLAWLANAEASVQMIASDVGTAEGSAWAAAGVDAIGSGWPVMGIIHASGVLEDAAFRNQSLPGLRRYVSGWLELE